MSSLCSFITQTSLANFVSCIFCTFATHLFMDTFEANSSHALIPLINISACSIHKDSFLSFIFKGYANCHYHIVFSFALIPGVMLITFRFYSSIIDYISTVELSSTWYYCNVVWIGFYSGNNTLNFSLVAISHVF